MKAVNGDHTKMVEAARRDVGVQKSILIDN